MYINDRKLSGSQSRARAKEQPITSQPAQRNSYYPDRVVSEFLGRVGTNSTYLWANEGLGQTQPICQASTGDLDHLSDSLKLFNKELKKTLENPKRLKNLRSLVLDDVDRISGKLDEYIDGGCCEPELKTLEAQVRALPWTFQRTRGNKVVRVERFRDIARACWKLINAIQEAQRKAVLHDSCSTPKSLSPHLPKSLADDLKKHITENGSSEVEVRVEEERVNLGRTIVIIAENHSSDTRTADLARRLLKNDVYRFIASEYFYNAGSCRTEIRDFMRRSRTSLGSLLCPYENLLRDIRRKPRYVLFVGSRREETTDVRDRRIARHFVEELADRKLNRTTTGILVCGSYHGSRVAVAGQQRTMRSRLEDAGFKILGARLASDDIDRACADLQKGIRMRTDTVWPVGETQTESNAIRLLDLVTTTSEYTVVPTRRSPFERVTDVRSGAPSSLSMADRYELVILAKSMQRPCELPPCKLGKRRWE